MVYVKIARITDLQPGEKKKLALGDKTILLANLDGACYAIDNTCPHMGGSLADGKLEDTRITCPRHGSVFDLRDGKLVESGKLFLLKIKVADVPSYALKIEGEDILIEL